MSLRPSKKQTKLQSAQAQRALQQLLLQSLTQSRLRHPSYSLRSLAQKIGCSPAAVSEILSNKRRVSKKIAARIIERLGIEPAAKQTLLSLFSTEPREQRQARTPHTAYTALATDQFKAVAEWYHFAILSLAETRDFRSDPQWIGARLNVGAPLIAKALERIERLGLMKRNNDGELVVTGEQFSTTDEIASTAIRGTHSAILDLARYSLERDQVSTRDFTTMIMAVDPARLVKAKKMIRQFREKLCEYLEQGDRSEVYQLGINLFPLSRQNGQISNKIEKVAVK